MNKKIALPIMIAGGIVAALVIAVLVMSFIYVNPLADMIGGDYDYVRVYNKSETSAYPVNEKTEEEMKAALNDSSFSVMHAVLEGRFSYAPEFKLVENDDGEKERVSYNMLQIMAVSADENNYMLEFAFATPKTFKVQGEEITYDRLKVLVYDTNGEIKKIEAVPYLYEKISTNDDDRLYYSVDVVEMYLTTSKLVSVLGSMDEIIK